jgi:hypothetical protein
MMPIASTYHVRHELTAYRSVNTDKNTKFNALSSIHSFLSRLKEADKSEVLTKIDQFKEARSGIRPKSAEEQEQLLEKIRWIISEKCEAEDVNYLMDDLYSLIKNDSSFFKRRQTQSYQLVRQYLLPTEAFVGEQAYTLAFRLLKNLRSRHPNAQLLFMLASNINKIKLSPVPLSQQSLVVLDYVLKGNFGTHPSVLKALIASLGKMDFTNPESQQKIAQAIRDSKCGQDPTVLKELISTLGKIKFTDRLAQESLEEASKVNAFGANEELLEDLVISLRKNNFILAERIGEIITENEAATSIQKAFRNYKTKTNQNKLLVDFAARKILMSHMKALNKIVTHSYTAAQANGEEDGPDKELGKDDQCIVNWYGFDYQYLVAGRETMSPRQLAQYLSAVIKKEQMICSQLAIVLAIKIREDKNLPKELRDNVYICSVRGHVMCCIGDPKNNDSLIIDPWVKYLNLAVHENWRSKLVRWDNQIRERGFMGSVAEYKKFLTDHPNKYVPEDVPKDICIRGCLTKVTKPIRTSGDSFHVV